MQRAVTDELEIHVPAARFDDPLHEPELRCAVDGHTLHAQDDVAALYPSTIGERPGYNDEGAHPAPSLTACIPIVIQRRVVEASRVHARPEEHLDVGQ